MSIRKLICFVLAGVVAWGAVSAHAPAARAIDPDSKEVKDMVSRALGFLGRWDGSHDTRCGLKALVGLCYLKSEERLPGSKNHPSVQVALQSIDHAIKGGFIEDMYSHGLAIMFLKEHSMAMENTDLHRQQIQYLVDIMVEKQKSHGGFGYTSYLTGDTSQTQYIVLGLWEAAKIGIYPSKVNQADVWTLVGEWLMRTQDPTGAWGYQGVDAGSYNLVAQKEVRHSLAAAGLSSMYIVRDYMGLTPTKIVSEQGPGGLTKVDAYGEEQAEKWRHNLAISTEALSSTLSRGDAWFNSNYRIDPPQHTHYYMYALERYESFKQLAKTGQVKVGNESWYNDGVGFLKNSQNANGSWPTLGIAYDEVPSTCFCILFLMRSTAKSIGKPLGDGTLTGSRGLPETEEERRAKRRIKLSPAEEIVELMGDPNSPEFVEATEQFGLILDKADPATLSATVAKLRELVEGADAEQRMAAIKSLGRTRNLDNVPVLILGLTDPDEAVADQARNSLQRITRRTYRVQTTSTDAMKAVEEEVAFWKKWYLSIRPNNQGDLNF